MNTLVENFREELEPRPGQTENKLEELVKFQTQATKNIDVCCGRAVKTGIAQP